MTFRCTITALFLAVLWFPGVAAAQGFPAETPAESTRYAAGTEQVGATMWRVLPRNTPYEQWFEKNK